MERQQKGQLEALTKVVALERAQAGTVAVSKLEAESAGAHALA